MTGQADARQTGARSWTVDGGQWRRRSHHHHLPPPTSYEVDQHARRHRRRFRSSTRCLPAPRPTAASTCPSGSIRCRRAPSIAFAARDIVEIGTTIGAHLLQGRDHASGAASRSFATRSTSRSRSSRSPTASGSSSCFTGRRWRSRTSVRGSRRGCFTTSPTARR